MPTGDTVICDTCSIRSTQNTMKAGRPQPADRRAGRDRRQVDHGPPPGVRERRVSVEPRKPEVLERELTNSEWDSLNEPMPFDRTTR